MLLLVPLVDVLALMEDQGLPLLSFVAGDVP